MKRKAASFYFDSFHTSVSLKPFVYGCVQAWGEEDEDEGEGGWGGGGEGDDEGVSAIFYSCTCVFSLPGDGALI